MLETKRIAVFFDSLSEYEKFNFAWTSICARLNPTERNTQRLGALKRRKQ